MAFYLRVYVGNTEMLQRFDAQWWWRRENFIRTLVEKLLLVKF